ncbi:hypothetical protein TBLA_0I02550 [Henningerozyma blattae CBS 6284]|uniref:Uncharacterized protein n=1 Tax=Henningerozyma blattae (strain ATCC 34711 / CBS 6284 / DSM 70876 / NBRC 10599 / NRRL Y-10934 / UCD 77-7) TaxID=1071380 RepID=I2H960_HENB6|nr:hypothetical protein TBLA_0I02550 [Tetrapisispora blattae CBS 6284]CCH62912.1 hypothetical protein TBLA_0I02550 [Tetrapisispora blattae CBS 6284]
MHVTESADSINSDPLVKIAPIKELHLEGPIASANKQKAKKLNYTVVEDLNQFEWFVKSKEYEALNKKIIEQNKQRSGLFKSLKPSMDTRVETQTLYFTDLATGKCGFIQLLYSAVLGGVYKGFQVNFKVFNASKETDEDIWESFKLDTPKEFTNLRVKTSNCLFEFLHPSKVANPNIIGHLHIKLNINSNGKNDTSTNKNARDLKINIFVDLFKGFMINPDGCTYFIDKPTLKSSLEDKDTISNKFIRHMFVPKCTGKGTISYHNKDDKLVTIKLSSVPMAYIDAVQGLLPNKAASRWNFMTFQGKNHSLLCMEYVTIKEYGNDSITIWSISQKDKLVTIGAKVSNNRHRVKYTETVRDEESGWDFPTAIRFPPGFKENNLHLVNRYDVMCELPSFIKSLAEKYAHIKPFIYQYCQNSTYHRDKGISIIETSFIS